MRRPRVLVLAGEELFRSFFDAPRERRLDRGYDWTLVRDRRVSPRLRRLLPEAEALVTTWDSPRFGEELLTLAPRLRLVAHCGGEVKGRFARPLFARLTIANAPGPMAPYVAELAVTFLLMAVRRVDEHRETLRRPSNAVYARLHTHGAGHETLRGRSVGLLGLGRIGRDTARLLKAFGPRLVAFDPYVSPRPPARSAWSSCPSAAAARVGRARGRGGAHRQDASACWAGGSWPAARRRDRRQRRARRDRRP